MRRRFVGVVLAAAIVPALLAGCTEQGVQGNGDAQTVDNMTVWKHPTGEPVDFSGPTADGARFSATAHRGKVVVVNFWYKDCGPCNAEAPILRTLSSRYSGRPVQFVGIDTQDGATDAKSFERQYRIGYPSVLDQQNGGAARLAFAASILPNSIPSTLVLDRKGRVVGRIIGQANQSVLQTMIDDAVSGKDA